MPLLLPRRGPHRLRRPPHEGPLGRFPRSAKATCSSSRDGTSRPGSTPPPKSEAALTAAIDRGRELIASRHRPDGFNIGINVGKAAGQTVFHLHVHLIPRYAGDIPDPQGGVRHVIPAKGNYLADG